MHRDTLIYLQRWNEGTVCAALRILSNTLHIHKLIGTKNNTRKNENVQQQQQKKEEEKR